MTWTVRVVPDAEAEFETSARWYDERGGLRTEFVEAIDEALYAIAEGPLRYPQWRPDSTYRKFVVRRFPYVVGTGRIVGDEYDESRSSAAASSVRGLSHDAIWHRREVADVLGHKSARP